MNNRVYVHPPGEDWIVDQFVREWSFPNRDICVRSPSEASVVWLIANWCWRQLAYHQLASKRVLTTVNHIVPQKFGASERADFAACDAITTAYHVPNQHTLDFIRPLTQKPIHLICYWANQEIWHPTGSKQELRARYGLPADAFIVGSFQRDTEGRDLVSPKAEKGPDLLADYLEKLMITQPNLHVLLAGWRRQYVIGRLEAAKIPYTYFERPLQPVLNELYQVLDLYPVTARYEGGPQALIECGLLGIPVVSRSMGIAEQVLPSSAIHDDVSLATLAVPNVEALVIPGGYKPYRDLLLSL